MVKAPSLFNQFNVIDTSEKAYWLGFIFARGCTQIVRGYEYFYISKQTLAGKKLLEKLKLFLNLDVGVNNPIKDYYNLRVSNTNLVNHIKPILENKDSLPATPTEYERDLVRGYFDAHGSWSICGGVKNGYKKNILFSITSMNLDILKQIRSFICRETKIKENKIYNAKFTNILRWNGNKNALKLYKYLYKDADIYLINKHQRIKNFLSEIYPYDVR